MSRETFDPPADRALDDLLDAAAMDPDDEVRPPGFADVLARLGEQGGDHGPGLEVAPSLEASGGDPDRLLELLVEAARAEAAQDAAAMEIPGFPAPPARRSSVVASVAITVAIAATVLLAIGIGRWSGIARPDEASDAKQAAAAQLDDSPTVHRAATKTPPSETTRPRRAAKASPLLAPEPEPDPEPDPAEAIPEETEPAELEPTPLRPAPRPRRDRLADLDAEAQARLAARDYAEAHRLLREIADQGGRRSVAQLAYGDLFMLAHREGDTAAQEKLWREYLRKFPRGRFADDARAGLCRHAEAPTLTACWTDYLADFPRGAYRSQARRVLGEPKE